MKICSKCKINKDLTEFNKNNSKKDKLQLYCKSCKKIEDNKYCNKNKVLIKENNKIKYSKNLILINELRELLGNKCIKCNENRLHLLDFHHLDPKEKTYNVTQIISYYGFGKNAIFKAKEEIKKCILLCSNCHRDFHYLEKRDGIEINTYIRQKVREVL